jgi:hypothetical protein
MLRAATVMPSGGDPAGALGLQFDRIVRLSFAIAQKIKRQPDSFFGEGAGCAVLDENVAAVGLHAEPLLAADESDGGSRAALAVSRRAEYATKLCRKAAANSEQFSFSLQMTWASGSCRLSPISSPLRQKAGALGVELVPVDCLGLRHVIDVVVGAEGTDKAEAQAADGG